jgi:pimeloyl-ACP methyl ester carboxylesterase
MMGPKLLARRSFAERPEVVAEVRRVVEATSPAAIACAQRGMASRPDMTGLLPNILVPTLVLVGQEDVISPPPEMRAMADAIPNAQFVEIADAGHMTTMENPHAVNTALRSFMSEIVDGS